MDIFTIWETVNLKIKYDLILFVMGHAKHSLEAAEIM